MLEDVAAGEDEVVVVGVEVGGGGLEAEAGDEAGAGGGVVGVEGVFADDDAGGEKGLDLAVAGGAVPAGGVDFELGPEVLADVVLEDGVGGEGAADGFGVAGGEGGTEVGEGVEAAPAFAAVEGGVEAGVGGAVFVAAGGRTPTSWELRR